MDNSADILKDEDGQRPIPAVWRAKIAEIVGAISQGDYHLLTVQSGLKTIADEKAKSIAASISAYGAHVLPLPEEAWRTSACQWMREYWDVLIDLYTAEEGASDLALMLRVYESGDSYLFEVQSVHVP
jgi:hypothetical protein